MSTRTIGDTSARNKENHASPDFAPVVGRGANKRSQLTPERVAELMEEQSRLVEARHAEEKPTREWIDLKQPKKVVPSERRLSSYTRDQQRVLECRLAVMRRAGVRDTEASAALDVAVEDLDELAGMAGQP